jgi:hypothetical protein
MDGMPEMQEQFSAISRDEKRPPFAAAIKKRHSSGV